MSLRIDVHLGPEDRAAALRADVLANLTRQPKQLSSKWFYDERGSELFDEITRLPEYYPTVRERFILAVRSAEIAKRTGADTLVEIGSGSSAKTRLLLDALWEAGTLRRFVPFDVSEPVLRDAAAAVLEEYPGIEVHAVVGDFERHIAALPAGGRRLVAFLGGTIGNFEPEARQRFLSDVAGGLGEDDMLLLGIDLVKDEGRLLDAYDDNMGVTAAFNRNVLEVLNRELGAHFEPKRFAHVVVWDAEREWVEMRLRAADRHRVPVDSLGIVLEFDEGEDIRTEVSAKFRRAGVTAELRAVGLQTVAWWIDPAEDFALSLSRRA